MASSRENKRTGRQLNRNYSRFSEPREYGEISCGNKRKASSNHSMGNTESKRATRSRGKNSAEGVNNNKNQSMCRKEKESQSSKIPLLNSKQSRLQTKHDQVVHEEGVTQKQNESPTEPPPQSHQYENFSQARPGEGTYVEVDTEVAMDNDSSQTEGEQQDLHSPDSNSFLASFLQDHGLNSKDPPPNVRIPTNSDIDLLQTLAFINQRLKKLDELEEMNSNLKGEITRVQSQVGEVSNQVTTVNSDLKRCEDKWEASTEAMMNRITKVEQGVQAFELKWESGISDVQDDISVIQSGVSSNTAKVKNIEAQLAEYKEKLDSLGSLEQEIKTAASKKFQEVQVSLKEEMKEEVVQEVRSAQEASNKEIKYDRLKDQAFNKRHNLVVFGLAENPSAEADRKAALTFFSERMNFPKLNVAEVYRLGTQGSRPRPMVVRFPNIVDRWAVWNKKGNIKYVKDQPVWLQEDLPKRLREDRRILQRVAKMAKSQPEKYADVKVRDYKVHINDQKYGREDLHLLPEDLSLERIYTPSSDKTTVFFTKHSPFSNHFHSPFKLEGIRFVCIEQYLAVQKAHLADDKDLARQAMESKDPADHKVVLNKLRQSVSEEWTQRAPTFISSAVRAKFTQNSSLAKFLRDSHPLLIGEASRDRMWGIGLSLEDPNVLDDSKWAPEGNLLGKTLVAIREELMNS